MRDPTDEYNDEHAIPRCGEYVEICISPPIHYQNLGLDTIERRLMMFEYFRNEIGKVYGTADRVSFPELSTGGLWHLHAIFKIDDPITFFDTLNRLKWEFIQKHKWDQKQIIAVYRVKPENLDARLKYISKDYPVVNKYWAFPHSSLLQRIEDITPFKFNIEQPKTMKKKFFPDEK